MGLHVGVLGTGSWSRVHLTALADSPLVDRVTLIGRNHEAAAALAAEFPQVAEFGSEHRRLLDDPTVEVVHVVLPHHLHAPRTLAALQAGKHVICEKPASTCLADFDAMTAAADTHGRRLLVVMNQLYNPIFRKLAELVADGAIGRPFLSVENSFSNHATNYRREDNWRNSVDRAGGGVLIDGGFHMVYRHLDTLRSVGTPSWVLADTPQLAVREDGAIVPSKGEDFVSATVGFDGPLRIGWAHGWTLATRPERARQSFIAGTGGTLELTDEAERPILLRRPEGITVVEPDKGPHTGVETTHACLHDYLRCLVDGTFPERASLSLARLTLATILAAYESGRTGRKTRIG